MWSSPDYLGYHYDPVDFPEFLLLWFSNANAHPQPMAWCSPITIATGLMAGEMGSKLVSQGTPNQLNYLVHYELVQEQSTNLWSGQTAAYAVNNSMPVLYFYHDNPRRQTPTLSLRFTTVSCLNGSSSVISIADGNWAFGSLTLHDCEINAAGAIWYENTTTNNPVELLENNLFHRPNFSVASAGQVTAFNNLFFGAVAGMYIFYNGSGTSSNTNLNNALDGCIDAYFDGIYSNNAYLNGTNPFFGRDASAQRHRDESSVGCWPSWSTLLSDQ